MTTRLADPDEATLRELLTKLANDSSRLVRTEAELAKREIDEKVKEVRTEAVKGAVAGAVAYAGGLSLIGGIVLLLGLLIPLWLSALIVGGLVSGAGGAMLLSAKKNVEELDAAPKRTIRRAKQDVLTLKEATR
jgi:hypothetical protein